MNTPEDMNSIAKMVNDTLRERKKPKPPSMMLLGTFTIQTPEGVIQLPIYRTDSPDKCLSCNQPVASKPDNCQCPCHQQPQ